MKRSRLLPVVIIAAAGLVTLPASAESTKLSAQLSADEEVPAKGPAGGTGEAAVEIKDGKTLCYDLTVEGIDEPTAGHIHKGPKGVAGPVTVDFKLAENGLKACVPADAAVVEAIVADPAGHYVNVHTAKFQAGAVRGQLKAG